MSHDDSHERCLSALRVQDVSPPAADEKAADVGKQHKMSETHTGEPGLAVKDVFDKELLSVGKDDVAKHHVGWLRDRMMKQMENVQGMAKKLGKVRHSS